MRLVNEHSYTYMNRWSVEDQAFVATVAEFPSLSWVDANAHTALTELHRVVRETLAEMKRTGETPPGPRHLTR